MKTKNGSTIADQPAQREAGTSQSWQFKTWPNGEIALCLYVDGQYNGEFYGPYTAQSLAEIVNHANKLSSELCWLIGDDTSETTREARAALAAYEAARQ